jgi:glycosyltransferase involved in cell wall biosynthesis
VEHFSVLEVVSGLGAGGAEKALLSRLSNMPNNFQTSVLNTRPELDALPLNDGVVMINKQVKFFLLILDLRKVLDEIKPDFIIVRTPLDAIRFALAKMFFRKHSWKLVFEVHSNFVTSRRLFRPVLEVILTILRSRIHYYFAVSENTRNGPLCQSRRNSSVVLLGGNSVSRPEAYPFTSPPKLLFLGRLTAVKRPLILVEAVSRLAKECTLNQGFLTMVGGGEMRKELDKFVEDSGLSGIIEVVGYKPTVSEFLVSCTHLVSVSSNEGLPISFFEAKLAGMRIISTPSGGGSEIFDEFDFELPSFEVDDLVSHLKTILNEEISGESRKLIASKSLWMNAENCSKKYYDLLRSLADR